MSNTLVEPSIWSLAKWALAKDGGVLDSTDVRADRPKDTSGHSAAPQTTGRKDSLAVAGSLSQAQIRIFTIYGPGRQLVKGRDP